MPLILRIFALVAFIVAAVLCLVVDAPDLLDILAAMSVGLACQAGADVATGRLP